jgi:hypothetical protein
MRAPVKEGGVERFLASLEMPVNLNAPPACAGRIGMTIATEIAFEG